MIEYLDDVSCSRCDSTTKDLSCNERTGWLWLCDDCLWEVELHEGKGYFISSEEYNEFWEDMLYDDLELPFIHTRCILDDEFK